VKAQPLIRVVALLATALAGALPGLAAPVPIPHGTAELLVEDQWIQPGRNFYLALNLKLERGWHTYWLNPGDSGEPPRIVWHLPAGLTAGPIEWPAPRRLVHSSITDYGYEDSVALLIPIHATSALMIGAQMELAADLKILVCCDVCIPGKAQLSLSLPVRNDRPAENPAARDVFASARKRIPRALPAGWMVHAREQKDAFSLVVRAPGQLSQAIFFPLDAGQIESSATQAVEASAAGLRITLRKSDQLAKPITRLRGVLVLESGEAYRVDAPVSRATSAGAGASF